MLEVIRGIWLPLTYRAAYAGVDLTTRWMLLLNDYHWAD